MLKVILFVIIILSVCILWAIAENNYHKRKNRKQREKDELKIRSNQELLYYKGIKKKHKFEKFCDN